MTTRLLWIKKKIETLTNWQNFIPIYTPSNLDFQPFLVDLFHKSLKQNTTHIITSWFDSDDIIAKSFTEMTQKQFQGQKFEYINFPYGYILHSKGLYLKRNPSNQFHSLIEETNNILTCKVMEHNNIYRLLKKGLPVKQVITKPIWMKLEHENNWCQNDKIKLKHIIPVLLKNVNDSFMINEDITSFINSSQYEYIFPYILNYVIKNQNHISIKERLKRLVTIFDSGIFPQYEKLTLKYKKKATNFPNLNITEIKAMCLNQSSNWRRNS